MRKNILGECKRLIEEGKERDQELKITWEQFLNVSIEKFQLLNEKNIRTAYNGLELDETGRIKKQ